MQGQDWEDAGKTERLYLVWPGIGQEVKLEAGFGRVWSQELGVTKLSRGSGNWIKN